MLEHAVQDLALVLARAGDGPGHRKAGGVAIRRRRRLQKKRECEALGVVGYEVVVMGRWGQRGLGCQDGWC